MELVSQIASKAILMSLKVSLLRSRGQRPYRDCSLASTCWYWPTTKYTVTCVGAAIRSPPSNITCFVLEAKLVIYFVDIFWKAKSDSFYFYCVVFTSAAAAQPLNEEQAVPMQPKGKIPGTVSIAVDDAEMSFWEKVKKRCNCEFSRFNWMMLCK